MFTIRELYREEQKTETKLRFCLDFLNVVQDILRVNYDIMPVDRTNTKKHVQNQQNVQKNYTKIVYKLNS